MDQDDNGEAGRRMRAYRPHFRHHAWPYVILLCPSHCHPKPLGKLRRSSLKDLVRRLGPSTKEVQFGESFKNLKVLIPGNQRNVMIQARLGNEGIRKCGF